MKIIKLKKLTSQQLPSFRTIGLWLFENLPTIVLFVICACTFYYFVALLVAQYLSFDTTVLIRYEAPKRIRFPAFTICGCSARNVVCTESSFDAVRKEIRTQARYSAMSILDNRSFTEHELVTQCNYFQDSRRPEMSSSCSAIETVVESLHDGRKCLTYFTILHDTHSVGQLDIELDPTPDDETDDNDVSDDEETNDDEEYYSDTNSTHPEYYREATDRVSVPQINNTETSDQYNAFIQITVNFTQFDVARRKKSNFRRSISSVQDSSVIMALHQTNTIPTMLDSEFIRIEPGSSYEIHFGKQVTYLREKPYWTACHVYDKKKKPRSRSECVHLCTIAATFVPRSCINYYTIVTREWLRHIDSLIEPFDAHRERLCYTWATNQNGTTRNQTTYDPYFDYVRARRDCTQSCARDCVEERYNFVTDISPLSAADFDDDRDDRNQNVTNVEDNNRETMTVITIWPDRKMYEVVQHNKQIDIFELIGMLGGHAHIWLGLSAIQLYDVIIKIVRRAKILFVKFVYCA